MRTTRLLGKYSRNIQRKWGLFAVYLLPPAAPGQKVLFYWQLLLLLLPPLSNHLNHPSPCLWQKSNGFSWTSQRNFDAFELVCREFWRRVHNPRSGCQSPNFCRANKLSARWRDTERGVVIVTDKAGKQTNKDVATIKDAVWEQDVASN